MGQCASSSRNAQSEAQRPREETKPTLADMDFKLLIRQHSDFILPLFQQVALREAQENVALSPISITVTLAMVAAGATGATLDQIVSCLHLSTPAFLHDFAAQVRSVVLADASPHGGPLLSFANGVWVERTLPLQPSFVDTVKSKYAAVAQPADFLNQAEKARIEINTWTKNETKGIIEEILPTGALDANSKCVLANALYFKGAWQNQFDTSLTAEEEFYLPNGKTLRVAMMTTNQKQEITTHDSFKVLRLPYNKSGDGRFFSMYIVLPHERNGLLDVEKLVNVDFLEQKLVKSTEVKVRSFKLPRFKVSGGYEMPEVLGKLGLTLPFSNQANFSNMVNSPIGKSLSVDKVYHKAAVEVNEEGTVAAAATAAVVMLRSIQPMEDFVADHPFLFVLKEDMTGMVVFIGHVASPTSQN
ncbi:hypothetical protein GOP47_0012545 [Adiantum capillus-veneris]|uniref:Serpin domain-containing protein n=1 Tax=Adiantum capillus-veneris TaxID=13818 RepID=A0A9D4UQW1_ADICA|nr:hypothetical protein GOP47_0012545 [Adiantum capillus-veneris]